ncbi:hypothetical protein SprV_0100125800 [Sparganum proliferum]
MLCHASVNHEPHSLVCADISLTPDYLPVEALALPLDETPSATPQEDTSTQQAIGSGDGRPAYFYSFSPILHPPPLPLTLCSTLFSYPALETSTDRRIATSKKLRLQPAGGYKVNDHPIDFVCSPFIIPQPVSVEREMGNSASLLSTIPPSPPPPPTKKSYDERNSYNTATVSPLILAAWNVRSLLDNSRSNRPEWRAAPVAWELTDYKVDIAALKETLFSEQGELEEVGAAYTFFRTGLPKAERRNTDVDFAIRNDIVGRLLCLPEGIIDGLMGLHLRLRGDKFVTIVSVYAPPPHDDLA